MARIFIDGFESGDFSLWAAKPYSGYVQNTVKYAHDYAACMRANPDCAFYALPSTLSTIYFQFRFRPTALAIVYAHMLLSFWNSSGAQAGLWLNTSGKLEVIKGPWTAQATGGTTLSINTWYLIEGKFTISSTVGVGQIKLNGVASPLEIDFSGDLQGQSNTDITAVQLGDNRYSSNGINMWYVDDLVLDDAAMPGGTQIIGTTPAGQGAYSAWTPSVAPNFECVNELPPNDVDNVSTNAVDNIDIYPVLPFPSIVGTVQAMQVAARCCKLGSATPTKINLALRTHGSDYVSSDLTPPSGLPNGVIKLWATNPNTSSAWTISELRDMQIGVKSKT